MNNTENTIVYLIQPYELLGTNIYKIGCSIKQGIKRITQGYTKGTKILHVEKCLNPSELEKIIIKSFRLKFKLVTGNEYFEGTEEEIKKEFYRVINNYNISINKSIDKPIDKTIDQIINESNISYNCKYCNKKYTSCSSRSNHIRIYHYNELREIKIPNKKCSYCNKELYDSSSKTKHEMTCKANKNNKINNNNLLIEELKKQNEELKIMVQKLLDQNNIENKNDNQINIIPIIPLGSENLDEILTEKEKLRILNCRANGVKELIDLVHISEKEKFNQFKNVLITNMTHNTGLTFDENAKDHIATNKNELIDDVFDCRMYDFELFYKKLGEKLDEETNKVIKRYILRINKDGDPLKAKQKEDIKLLFYNNREKIKKIIKKLLNKIKK
jgi:hypothetical protein